MITRTVQANQPPEEWNIGQIYVCCNFDVREIQHEDDPDSDPYTLYEYTEITLSPTEYAAILNGKYKGEYNASFRRKERETLLTQADKMKEKANDYISSDFDTEVWQQYLDDIIEYKIAVRETVNQSSFPLSVTYPPFPPSPNP